MEPRIIQRAGSCPLAMLSLPTKHATRVAYRLDTGRQPVRNNHTGPCGRDPFSHEQLDSPGSSGAQSHTRKLSRASDAAARSRHGL
jgi:hypothetical protein